MNNGKQQQSEIQTLQTILERLAEVDEEARTRIVQTVSTFYGLVDSSRGSSHSKVLPVTTNLHADAQPDGAFSDRREMSPKEFMLLKEPQSDIERVAVLAFYLTHYQAAPHFKTIDITKVNTEAAQAKFSNAALAVNNAALAGFLVPAGKGQKQLGGLGEQFVQALPDRTAAKTIRERLKRRRGTRPKANHGAKAENTP